MALSLFCLVSCIGTQRPAPVMLYGSSAGGGSAGVHTVVAGENLWTVSRRYNIVMRDIVYQNNLTAPFMLNPGQRLRLPPPREYRVRAGDSLYSVSRIFDISSTELASLNHISAPYIIQPGQVLKLPSVLAKKPVEPSAAANAAQPSVKPGVKPKVQQASAATRAKVQAQTPKRSSSKFLKPVSGSVISSYGPKAGGLYNDGINIRAARGTPVQSAENGVVVYAGNELKGSGNLVLLRHEDRWMTAYAHMDRVLIKRGQEVKRGQSIGTVGSSGNVDAPQLHFEVRRGTEALNPRLYLEK